MEENFLIRTVTDFALFKQIGQRSKCGSLKFWIGDELLLMLLIL